MAWTRGELITADKLNSENATKSLGSYHASNSGSTPWIYCHCGGKSRKIMDWSASTSGGLFDKAFMNLTLKFKQQATKPNPGEGYGNTIYNLGKNESASSSVSASEDGWYCLQASGQNNSLDVTYYPYNTNCVRGDFLVVYDDPTVSGRTITGEKITAELLNTGRVGTEPSI